MKKLSLFMLFAVALTMFTSCEKDHFAADPYEQESIEGYAKSNSNLPTTIDDLRTAGIAVSNNIANIVNNDLGALLEAAELAANISKKNRRKLRRLGFKGGQIKNQLPRIYHEYLALVESLENQDTGTNPDPADEPTDEPTDEPQTYPNEGTEPDPNQGPTPDPVSV